MKGWAKKMIWFCIVHFFMTVGDIAIALTGRGHSLLTEWILYLPFLFIPMLFLEDDKK